MIVLLAIFDILILTLAVVGSVSTKSWIVRWFYILVTAALLLVSFHLYGVFAHGFEMHRIALL